jgi:hypothetical protein
VRDELKKLRVQMVRQRSSDRATFSGLFDRGELTPEGSGGGSDGCGAGKEDDSVWNQQAIIAQRQVEGIGFRV